MSDYDPDALEQLADAVGRVLSANGQRLVTAESCTGGWVGQCLTAIAGCSRWYDRGYITYSNEAKTDSLAVDVETLSIHGAVSEATARSMAVGARRRSGADWALAITGLAGPGGGSASKPVGTVCFSWAGPDGSVDTATQHFTGSRRAVRAQSVAYALAGLIERAGRLRA